MNESFASKESKQQSIDTSKSKDETFACISEYPTHVLIDGYSIYVESYMCTEQFEIALKSYKPSKVVLLEPTLEFMRALEIYNAERNLV